MPTVAVDDAGVDVRSLATTVGTTVADVERWTELGLLGEGGRLRSIDRARAVLIVDLLRRGATPERIAAAIAEQGDLLGQFGGLLAADGVLFEPTGRGERRTHADPAVVDRLRAAAGIAPTSAAPDDDRAVELLDVALGAGLPEQAIAQLVRVYADAAARIAEAEVRLFHQYVHEPLRVEGVRGPELTATTAAVSGVLTGLSDPALLYFHQRALRDALLEDLLTHVLDAGVAPPSIPGEMEATVLFVDLSGFTPLTETMGDAAAADVVDRFSVAVRAAASEHGGRVVKQIGDEFMLVFRTPGPAVRFGIALAAVVDAEARFPDIRTGAHHGRLLYRDGDYLGSTVNLAARVTSAAAGGQFLVTDDVRSALADAADVELLDAGRRALKGFTEAVTVHEVVCADRLATTVDPVCRMRVDPAAAVLVVRWEGADVAFCSEGCAERFRADPARYPAADAGSR